jgi:DNA-binding SARP family transcriptional activator
MKPALTTPAAPVPSLSIRLLGPLAVQLRGASLPRLRSRKGDGLFTLLVLRAGQDVSRAWLAATLWPDSSPSGALALLRRELTALRRALGPEAARLISPTFHTLRLDLSGCAYGSAEGGRFRTNWPWTGSPRVTCSPSAR